MWKLGKKGKKSQSSTFVEESLDLPYIREVRARGNFVGGRGKKNIGICFTSWDANKMQLALISSVGED